MSTESPEEQPVVDESAVYGWPDDERTRWLETWAPKCPIGNPQRVRECLAYREREPGRLQLRVPLGVGEGVCEVVVQEDEEAVRVRVLVCYEDNDEVGQATTPGADDTYSVQY